MGYLIWEKLEFKGTLLSYAVMEQNLELARMLLKAKAHVNQAPGSHGTALQFACICEVIETV